MYTKEQLQGIMLGLAIPEISVFKDDSRSMGYGIRVAIHIRSNMEFLEGIERTLLQYNIKNKIKDKESKSRPRPILSIKGNVNCYNMLQLIPALPSHHDWEDFEEAVEILHEGKHTTRQGFDEILRIKGLL